MKIQRPDTSQLDSSVIEYILFLENELERIRSKLQVSNRDRVDSDLTIQDESEAENFTETSEPVTTKNVIIISFSGFGKRTLRHKYMIQRRGGMGVFDLETNKEDPPVCIAIAEPDQTLLLITNYGRGFRIPIISFSETPVHSRGISVVSKFELLTGEGVAKILPIQAQGYVALLGETGMVRLLRHHIFGEHMKPGTYLIDQKTFGNLGSACWINGDSDIFIATKSGKAIRFAVSLIPPQGVQAVRIQPGDQAKSILEVGAETNVFLLSSDGKGSIRPMSGFSPNKSPGAGGKNVLTTDELVGACAVSENDQILIISEQSKIIRFHSREVPVKDAVVQGVVCMALRADKPVALTHIGEE